MHNHMSPSLLVILGGDTELANAPGSDATFRMESDNDHEHQMDIVGKGPCIPVLSSLKSWSQTECPMVISRLSTTTKTLGTLGYC
jgi:hypothetical protein